MKSVLKQIPNCISVIRILLVIPVVYYLLQGDYYNTLILFAIAGLSDALDGFLAENLGWRTWLGGVLDPLADKLLLISSYIALGYLQLLPVWLVALILLRDIIIIIGVTMFHFMVARLDPEPSLISKINTFMQITLGLVVILAQLIDISSLIITFLIATVAITTMISGTDYFLKASKRRKQFEH